jgi:uncharacterized protein (DUF427 family)
MSLTVGTGPFGERPAGRFNTEIEPPGALIFWDPVAHRIRAIFAGETIVDSTNAKLLHETGRLPVYYFPEEDLRADLLESSDHSTHCPYKGQARYRSIRVGDRVAENAIWSYPDPIDSVPFLVGHAALYWDAVDEWFVEDEQAFGHPRDPYSRIDVYPTSRRVRVLLDGEVLADSRRAKILFETALPPRYYLPQEDVRMELLGTSSKKTRCAYKGSASYWHVRVGRTLHENLVWTYREPQHDAEPVKDMLAFFNERVDLEIEGEVGERPVTQWSRGLDG